MGTTAKHTDSIETVRDIAADERQEIEDMLDEGIVPLQISKELDIPVRLIQNIRRNRGRGGKVLVPTSLAAPAALLTPEEAALKQMQAQYQSMSIQDQIEEMQEDITYNRELRRRKKELAVEKLELENELLRKELIEGPSEETPGLNPVQIARDPQSSFWSLAEKALEMNMKQKQNPIQGLDVTKDLSKEQIQGVIKTFHPKDIKAAQDFPDSAIAHGLRSKFPGITGKNIKLAIQCLREHVHSPQRSQARNQRVQQRDSVRTDASTGNSENVSSDGKLIRKPKRAKRSTDATASKRKRVSGNSTSRVQPDSGNK
jgi:hypothetical protein